MVVIAALAAYAVLRPAPVGGVADGAAVPNFSFTTVSGSAASLAAYLGHPPVLWFVATFCSSCGEGTQIFVQQYDSSYHTAQVTVLELASYNNDGTGKGPTVSAFASAYGYTGQPGWVLGTASAHGTRLYNPQSDLDVYYVINAQGRVVLTGTGLDSNFGGTLRAAAQCATPLSVRFGPRRPSPWRRSFRSGGIWPPTRSSWWGSVSAMRCCSRPCSSGDSTGPISAT